MKNQERNGFENKKKSIIPKEPLQANPGTIKTCDQSAGHARADDDITHQHPAPMAQRRGTARPRCLPQAPDPSPVPADHPAQTDIIRRQQSTPAWHHPEALHSQRPCHCFALLLNGCFVNFVLIVKLKCFSFENGLSS